MTVLFWLGCVNPGSLAGQAARAECGRQVECGSEVWTDADACLAELEPAYDGLVACYAASCSFHGAGAAAWLRSIRQAECDTLNDAVTDLDAAWEDCDNVALTQCLLGS